jgi:hypothetical protein
MAPLASAQQWSGTRWFASRPGFRASLLALALLCAHASAWAEVSATKEYQIKAAFLFNFAQFVEWPSGTFTDSDVPVRIGVLGDDPFGSSLDETIRGETVRGRKLVVERSPRLDELLDCQILFIGKSEKAKLSETLGRLSDATVLTVSDLDGFTSQGGVIRFYLQGNKIRFEINLDSAQKHGLKMSAQLLSLGKVLSAQGDQGRK